MQARTQSEQVGGVGQSMNSSQRTASDAKVSSGGGGFFSKVGNAIKGKNGGEGVLGLRQKKGNALANSQI